MGQQVEIEEKTRAIALLKSELKKLREMNEEQASQMSKDAKLRLTTQRKEFEAVINRHLSFIDKLLGEKDDLSKRCDALTEEVKTMEKGFKEKLKTAEEQQARDLKQQRELWQAAEKIKRDKWIAEKTKSIKDQTVKGLEPEIQRMLAQHKSQLRLVEERAKDELNRERIAMAEATQRQIEALREKMVAERQKACEEEREYARQRYQKQLERDEIEFQQQKRKLLADFEEQKHYLTEEHKRERQADQLESKKAYDALRGQLERTRAEDAAAADEARRRHAAEMATAREKMALEKEVWQEQFMARQEAEMRARDKQLKERLLKERDEELELIVQRLESETNSTASDAHRRFRMDVEKLKAEASEEIKQLRDQHSIALDNVISARAALEKCEEEKRELQKQLLKAQHECQSKETLVQQQRAELSRLKVDEDTLSTTIRSEFQEQLSHKDTEIGDLQARLGQATAKAETLERQHAAQVQRLLADKDEELRQVEERVVEALGVKDEIANGLRFQLEEMAMRNETLNQLIEKQRAELLS